MKVKLLISPGKIHGWIDGVKIPRLIKAETHGGVDQFPVVTLTLSPEELEVEYDETGVQIVEKENDGPQ